MSGEASGAQRTDAWRRLLLTRRVSGASDPLVRGFLRIPFTLLGMGCPFFFHLVPKLELGNKVEPGRSPVGAQQRCAPITYNGRPRAGA